MLRILHTIEATGWIDIFPVDYLPLTRKKQEGLIKKCYFYRAIILAGTTDFKAEKIKNKSKKVFLNIICKIVGIKRVYKRYDKLIKSTKKYKGSDYVACLAPTYGLREIFRKDLLFTISEYKFEDSKFYGPKDYDKYLSQQYGDYMKLPPEEKRRTHQLEAYLLDNKEEK